MPRCFHSTPTRLSTAALSIILLLVHPNNQPSIQNNSGISKIYILTQFNSTSLNRHLARTYNMGSGVRFGGEGFVEVLAATQVRG
jgi:hypothetical protein